MKVLLDTHILLWWLTDDSRLSTRARGIVGDPTHVVVVSAASLWEIAIKRALGKLSIDGDLIAEIGQQGFTELPITFAHAMGTGTLPSIHRDPFDRLLVSQARHENMRLLSNDPWLLRYPVNVIEA